MKIIALLVLAIVAAQAVDVGVIEADPFSNIALKICLPDVFTTYEATFIPTESDVFVSQTFFDFNQQKSRTDYNVIVIDHKPIGTKVSYLFDFTKSVYYKIDYLNHTATCEQHPLTGKLPHICLAKDAEKRGEFTLGGTLVVENWIERFRTKNGTVRVDLALAKNIEIPVRLFTRDAANGFTTSEYWDWRDTVHHDAFNVPSVCRSNQVTLSTRNPETRKEILAAEHPMGEANLFVAKA